MHKIPSLFKRDYEGTRLAYNEVVDGSEWVLRGEGRATPKYDGTACLYKDGILYKRYNCRPKTHKSPPDGFVPCMEPDVERNHWFGWIPVGDGPEDKYHRLASTDVSRPLKDGQTYELVGPKVQGNPERQIHHVLLEHGETVDWGNNEPPRTFEALREWFEGRDIEGIVWHHSDGRMVKIKGKDFGIKRNK